MTHVFMIHGFLGTGKTTFAKQLSIVKKAVRISPDEWYIALYGKDGQVGIDEENERRVRRLIGSIWPELVRAGTDVVLDFGFWTRAERDEVRMMVKALGAQATLIEMAASEEVALKRCLSRNDDPTGCFFIDRETYSRLRTQFEPLDQDETRRTVLT